MILLCRLIFTVLLAWNAKSIGIRHWNRDHCVESGCYPLYYILGSPKSGTTSLWDLFSEIYHSNLTAITTPCVAERKELRYWSQPLDNYQLKLRKYQSFFPRENTRCPSSLYMEATPTYLGEKRCACLNTYCNELASSGDIRVPYRMKQDIPLSAHNRMKFIASLRDPISRDLSWFNVLYDKCAKRCAVVMTTRAESESILRLNPIIQIISSLQNYGANKAGILVIPIQKICRISSNGKMYLLDAVTCYDRYVEVNMKLYNDCEKTAQYDEQGRIVVHSVLDNLISISGLDSTALNYIISDLNYLINVTSNQYEIYTKCYKSSILRTGKWPLLLKF